MNKKLFVKPENKKLEIPKKGMMFINEYGLRQLIGECNVNSADKAKKWLLNPKYVDRGYTVVGTSKFHKNGQAKKSKGKQKKKFYVHIGRGLGCFLFIIY